MAESGLTIGVDMGGTKVLGVLADADGTILEETRVPTPRGTDFVLDALGDVAAELQSRTPSPVEAIGVGVPGSISFDGIILSSPNLPGVTNAPVKTTLEKRFPDSFVYVDNDANCAAWGERCFGAGRRSDEMLLITLGTGIGSGIVTGGKVLRGFKGFAGEVGHMVVDVHGPPCPCGKRGCWERFSSGTGLGRLAREMAYAHPLSLMVELAGGDTDDVNAEHVTAAAAQGDAVARETMDKFAWWLAVGLSNLVNTVDPEIIVLGGGLAELGPVLLDPARAAFADLLYGSDQRGVVPLALAELGEHAGAIGASALARLRS